MLIYNTYINYSLRMYVAFEQITGRGYDGSHPVTDTTILLYSALTTARKAPEGLTYDALLSWLDDNPRELRRFAEWVGDEERKVRELTRGEAAKEAAEEDKKKEA